MVLLVQFVPNVQQYKEAEGQGQSSHYGGEEEMVERRKSVDRRKRVGRKMVV
jgi:hypothetical protein